MSGIITRRIRTGEWLLYRELRLEALRDAPEAFCATYERALDRSDRDWQEQADAAAEGADRAIVFAFEGELAVGLAAAYRDGVVKERVELLQVWVARSARGKGVGRALMDTAMDWAMGAGFREVLATVKFGNEAASPLYLKLGFSAEGKSEDGWVFRKPLQTPDW